MIKLLVKLVPGQFCVGCGGRGHCEEKSGLCCYCYGQHLALEERKWRAENAFVQALAKIYRSTGEKIRKQLQEWS